MASRRHAARKRANRLPELTRKQKIDLLADRLSVLADIGLRLKGVLAVVGPHSNAGAIAVLLDAEMKDIKRYLREVLKVENVHLENIEWPPSGFAVAGPTHLTFM